MNLWLAALTIAVAVAVAIVVMFFVRRRAPVGGFFTNTDRSVGIFGVLGTSFAVMLAFVIFLAFESYGTAKQNAGTEAVSVTGLFGTARLFPGTARGQLRGALVCYGRSVVADEWSTMKDGHESPIVDDWAAKLDAVSAKATISGEKQSAGYGSWLEQSAARRDSRRGRLAEAAPFVPAPIWAVLLLGAAIVLGYTFLYADRGESFAMQAVMIGTVTAIVVSGLLVVRFLDRPYENESGSIAPTAMIRTLKLIDVAQRQQRLRIAVPCDAGGRQFSQ